MGEAMIADAPPRRGLSDRDVIADLATSPSSNTATVTHTYRSNDFSPGAYLVGLHDVGVDRVAAFVETRLGPISALRRGWNSHSAPPVAPEVLEVARELLTQIVGRGMSEPQVVPTSRGGLTLEWASPTTEFAITLHPDADVSMTAYYADDDAGLEWELPLPTADLRVEEALSRLERTTTR